MCLIRLVVEDRDIAIAAGDSRRGAASGGRWERAAEGTTRSDADGFGTA